MILEYLLEGGSEGGREGVREGHFADIELHRSRSPSELKKTTLYIPQLLPDSLMEFSFTIVGHVLIEILYVFYVDQLMGKV